MSRTGGDSLVRLYRLPPERGKLVDGLVRPRWAEWLEAQLGGNHLGPDDLARELASNPADMQTWPRDRVRRWLRRSVTVSVAGAFETGSALAKLAVPTCGPEALFASGHLAAFIAWLEYLGDEPGDLRDFATTIAIFPFVAYARRFRRHSFDGESPIVADAALKALHRTEWPHDAFLSAFARFAQGKEIRERGALASALTQGPLSSAFQIALRLGTQASFEDVACMVFPHVADWVVAAYGWSDTFEKFAAGYESMCAAERSRFRRTFLRKR